MPDREKVIKGLSELEGFLFKRYGEVSSDETHIWYDRFLAVSDALALLKEQEPVVRCKDCKYHGNINPDYCVNLEQNTNDDFLLCIRGTAGRSVK